MVAAAAEGIGAGGVPPRSAGSDQCAAVRSRCIPEVGVLRDKVVPVRWGKCDKYGCFNAFLTTVLSVIVVKS